MKILVAHEDVATRDLIVAAAKDWGVKVACTGDGIRAWELLNGEEPPNLIILGWVLPNVSALEICRRLRGRNSLSYNYIITMAARATDRNDMKAAFQAGANDYVDKPFDLEEIRGRMRTGCRMLERDEALSRIVLGWRSMLDSLPFGVACLGSQGQLLRANKVFAELLGYEVTTFAGGSANWHLIRNAVNLSRLLPNDLQRNLLLESVRGGKSFDHTLMRMVQADGRQRDFVVWGRAIPSVNDMVFQVVVGVG